MREIVKDVQEFNVAARGRYPNLNKFQAERRYAAELRAQKAAASDGHPDGAERDDEEGPATRSESGPNRS